MRVAFILTGLAIFCAACGGPERPESTPSPATQQAGPDKPNETAVKPLLPAADVSREVTIYRDEWGVPHVYAEEPAAAAFGIGYAQAEDRLEDIYKNVRTAIGRMAEAFGPEYVEQDYYMRLARNDSLCQEYWGSAPADVKAAGDAFMAGVNAYVAEHPERQPEFALPLEGWQCVSVSRAMILRWPLGAIQDELERREKAPDFGSNAWAVAPSRSADHCAILLTDPHLTWEGLAVFYEIRARAGDLAMCGYALVGSPLIAIGHNDYVGWGCTTGGPDTSDVYKLKINPDMPLMYEYDGEWRTGELVNYTIHVKGADPVNRPAVYTHLGPFVSEPDTENGIAYAGASPYFGQAGAFEQMYRALFAKSCDDLHGMMGMNQLMEQNILSADTQGNIEYVRLGRTPIRPDGYDWTVPVPGNTSASAWQGIHDIADLVQIRNPEQGYFQNCNISPELMMHNSPLTPEKYKEYLYNVSWDYSNPRGRRALELLSTIESMTKEQAMAVAMDVYDPLSKRWAETVKQAASAVGAEKMKDPDFAAAVNALAEWNGEFTPDSAAAALMKPLRLKFPGAIDFQKVAEGGTLSGEDQARLLDLLSTTIAEFREKYGTAAPAWGDINKVGRGEELYPSPGADFGGGTSGPNLTETLLCVAHREEPKGSGAYVAFQGSMSLMLMFFHTKGVESYSCIPWGQNADPQSPHFMDQGEKLYSQRQFKPTWFKQDELAKHTESEKTLPVPGTFGIAGG